MDIHNLIKSKEWKSVLIQHLPSIIMKYTFLQLVKYWKQLQICIAWITNSRFVFLVYSHLQMIKEGHITYMYIESLSSYFRICLLQRFVSQGSFSQPSSQWPAQASLRDKSWRETIFKIMAGRIIVSTYM